MVEIDHEADFEFQEKMGLKTQNIIMIPTLLDRSTLSQQIYAQYLAKFSDYIIPIPIRTSVKGQEALVLKQTILEYAPSSSLSQDYYELIKLLWGKISGIKSESLYPKKITEAHVEE